MIVGSGSTKATRQQSQRNDQSTIIDFDTAWCSRGHQYFEEKRLPSTIAARNHDDLSRKIPRGTTLDWLKEKTDIGKLCDRSEKPSSH